MPVRLCNNCQQWRKLNLIADCECGKEHRIGYCDMLKKGRGIRISQETSYCEEHILSDEWFSE